MADILRTLGQLGILNNIELNFIEASPFLKNIQQESIQKTMGKYGHWFEYQTDNQLYDRFISSDPEKYFEIKWYSMYE